MQDPVAPSNAPASTVRRRHVFYVSGFDPQGPAHYHRLYAENAARQAAVSGYAIDVGQRKRGAAHTARWEVNASWSGEAPVSTTVEFLRWDDIVRQHWPRSRLSVMASALWTTAVQLRNGVLWRILKTSWPAFVALIMPPLVVLALAAGFGLVMGLAYGLAIRGSLAAGAACGVGGWLVLWRLFGWAEARVQMSWLMRSTRFILRQARGRAPELEARLDEFADLVAQMRDAGEVDEILLVGHSSGAMLAVSIAARVLGRDAPAHTAGSTLSLLTLGECIPVLSYQPQAVAFRRELSALGASSAWAWTDFTAPPDGCCFALVDPTAVCPDWCDDDGWNAPKRMSPRFAQLFGAASYQAVRRDKMRCHFQYLMASELPGAYDYFAITAGAVTLAERFASAAGVKEFRDFQMFGGPG